MYWCTQSPNPIAAPATATATRDEVRPKRTSANPSTAPAKNVITASALALRDQKTSDGGARISSALAIQAMPVDSISFRSTNCRQTKTTKHASVVAFSAVTEGPVTANTAAFRYTSGTPLYFCPQRNAGCSPCVT